MTINLPELSLVVLIGPSGAGKSTFATTYFEKYEVVSSDVCRGIVSNDENDQSASKQAFELLNYIVSQRLEKGLLTVVDATNVQAASRKKLVELARKYHVLPTAIILDVPQAVCEARNENRADRTFGSRVIRAQRQQLRKSLRGLKREGFRKIYHLKSTDDIAGVTGVVREKLYNDKREERGAFDIIGDIHGCFPELRQLLERLGYEIATLPFDLEQYGFRVTHPDGRRVILLGDLTDRGPDSPAVLKLAMSMVSSGLAFCVVGNHDAKLSKYLSGKRVRLKHGLEVTAEQLAGEDDAFLEKARAFLYGLISHYVMDDGKLVVAHAGIKESMQGRGSGAVRSFCMYGDTSGEIDEFGLPVRHDWAAGYRGGTKVIYGHTPVPEAEWVNRTMNIDTGCVFGGKLTALRYPEEELVSIPAARTYCEPVRPLLPADSLLNGQQAADELLDISDVTGKRIVQTRLRPNLTIREENSIAALEVMSRFAVDPKWLIYLPPTMSPCATSDLPDYLEHPREAIAYFTARGIKELVCEEKHMGSRAILVICKDEEAVLRRFGIEGGGLGVCYTRTGRPFFTNADLERTFLERVRRALSKSGFWEAQATDWVCLDAELMPWSAKAQSLLKGQYAAVGAAGRNAFDEVSQVLSKARERNIDGLADLQQAVQHRTNAVDRFTEAYRQYCWEVKSVDDYTLAPFHVLATEGAVHADKPHRWHLEEIQKICAADPALLLATTYNVVDTTDEASVQRVIDWWVGLTAAGGEGMVVKPALYTSFYEGRLIQPAVKCRGKEYLRIIYGPEYDKPEHLRRLKKRGLSTKRSLALREFALGLEGLERFVRKESLRRVHESVFGVLALESEAVDPRL